MSTPTNLFADAMTVFTAKGGGSTIANVSHEVMSLGAADARGIYAESFAAPAPIQMPTFTKATQRNLLGLGVYVRTDALGITNVYVKPGDRITVTVGAVNYVYRVMSTRVHPFGNIAVSYEADLSLYPF